MNRKCKLPTLILALLWALPTATIACPQDCGDCYYWNGYYCEPLGECQSVWDCTPCARCMNCYCEDWDFYCQYWYDDCHYCDNGVCVNSCGSCENCVNGQCVCAVVTSVSGVGGTYCVGDSATVTANGDFPSGCVISWSGPGYFSNIEGSSATITFTSTGTNLRISASTGCQTQPTWSPPFNVVGVASVSPSNACCWDGGQITFSATPDPGSVGFPGGQPVWTASAGSFPGGNTGPNVTWQAPSGTGGYATITATCGSSNADDTVSYGFVSIGGSGGDLLRSASDVFYATVQPADFPVSFAQHSSTSPHLSVNPLWGTAIEIENLILASDAHAYVDTALAGIQAIAPNLDIRLFGRSYNLKKMLGNVASTQIIPDAQDIFEAMGNLAESQGGGAAYDTFISSGFNSARASSARSDVEAIISQGFSIIDPFPASVTDSIINESRTYTVTGTVSVQAAGLSFTLLPGFEPPGDVGAWIRSINEHGFSGVVTDLIAGPKVTLNITASGSNWSVPFSASLDFSDNWGKCTFSVSVGANIYIGPD